MRCRWLEEPVPGDPWQNMARDLASFEELQNRDELEPIIRLYQWDRPCVTIGRLQEAHRVMRTFPELPIIRRPTGGRAVVHGNDLTISVIARDADLPQGNDTGVLSSYRTIVRGIVHALRACGMQADMGAVERDRGNDHIVRCFELIAGCDVVDRITGRKLVGSAQRRQNGAILQQMSLPGLAGNAAFVRQVQASFEMALKIDEWVCVDTI